LFPESCAHVWCRWVIPKWRTRIIPIGFERRAPLPRCRACYAAVGTAPLCGVVGATAPPLEKTYRGTPVGSLLIGVRRCVPVVPHDEPVSVRRKTLSVVVFLPKQDESVPRCLAGGDGGRVIPQPLDAEASSWPPCCETFRSGSEMRSCFVATTPEVFAKEASEA
jgi:hypothetical protein